MFPTDHDAASEPARSGRAQAHDGGDGRVVLRQLRTGAPTHRARHRRHRGPRLRAAAALVLQCTSRQPLLHADPHLRGDFGQAGRGFPAAGQDPDGMEVCLVLRHVVRAIRARWPRVDILIRGDSHYGRPEAMAWCERNRVGYIFGLAGNKVLLRCVTASAEQVALDRLDAPAESKVRRYAEFWYGAKTWKTERRVIARLEASSQGVDSRFIVTNLAGLPKSLYEKIYCARGQAENLIKAHKLHLASDRTSCTKASANQFRLLIHTAAYWLMHTLRARAPKTSFWRDAQFDTMRLSLIKVAVRVTELVTKIKISLPTGFAYQHGFSTLAARLAKLPP